MRNKLYLLLVLLVGIVQVGMAQEKTITGVVTDADDGSPLPGVSVVIKGTHLGTATDAMGKYSIRIDGKAVLVFTFIGMQTQEIPVNNRSVVNVNLRVPFPESSSIRHPDSRVRHRPFLSAGAIPIIPVRNLCM